MISQRTVTAERIERALDGLAKLMAEIGPSAKVYLPIYQSLERDLAALRDEDDAMASVLARAQRARRGASPAVV